MLHAMEDIVVDSKRGITFTNRVVHGLLFGVYGLVSQISRWLVVFLVIELSPFNRFFMLNQHELVKKTLDVALAYLFNVKNGKNYKDSIF